MLSAGERSNRSNPLRATREAYPELTLAIFVLLVPVVWWTPWPYRLPALAIIAGLLLERLPNGRPLPQRAAAACSLGRRRPAGAIGRADDIHGGYGAEPRPAGRSGQTTRCVLFLGGNRCGGGRAAVGRTVDAAVAAAGSLLGRCLRSGHADVPGRRTGMDYDRRRAAELDPATLGPMGLDAGPLRARRGRLAAGPRGSGPGPIPASCRGE